MIKLPRLPATPEMGLSELDTFRRQLLLFWLVFIFYDVWIFLIYPLSSFQITRTGYICLLWGTCVSLFAYLLRRYWPRVAAWFTVLGSLVLGGLIYVAFGQVLGLAHLAILIPVAGLLLGMRASTLVALGGLVLAFYPSPLTLPLDSLSYWPAIVLFLWGLTLLLVRGFRLMDYWEEMLGVQQHKMISELRHRQGELNRALKALEETFDNLKRANDELVIAHQEADEARALKEQFVANVSHELRTPLNLIVGFVELMYLSPETYDGMEYTPEFEHDLRQLFRAGRHLQDLVNDVLDLSRIDASRLPILREYQDLRAVIADAVDTVAPLFKQRGLSHTVAWPDALPHLFIDRTRIRQVMLNLLNNAARFTDDGGIQIKVEQAQEEILVQVQDTGVGIPGDQLEHIFEEFRQVDGGLRSRGGAGLGLAISRRFVQMHGGRMWVESQMDQGSSFFFTLPLPGAQSAATPMSTQTIRKEFDVSTAPIIVVDPDPSVAELLHRHLGQHPILSAATIEEAEVLIERAHPLAVVVNTRPDTPMQDWLGTLGHNSERYAVPLLRCSIPSASWLQHASGFDAVLTKPISRGVLTTTISRLCGRPACVLVVDDDAGFVSLVTRMLSTVYLADQVLSAYSGMQAVQLVHETTPDLVFLDLLMPGMDGFQVLHTLRSDPKFQNTLIVAVTATTYAEEALLRNGGHFSLTRSAGIPTGSLLDLIQSSLEILRPDYTADVGHPS